WGAERDVVAAQYQHLAELDDLAGIALDLVDLEHILGGNAVLLAAGSDDCEHRSRPRVRPRCSDWSGPASFARLWVKTPVRPGAGQRGLLMAAPAETVKETGISGPIPRIWQQHRLAKAEDLPI